METIDRANRKLPRICAYLIDAIIIILLTRMSSHSLWLKKVSELNLIYVKVVC